MQLRKSALLATTVLVGAVFATTAFAQTAPATTTTAPETTPAPEAAPKPASTVVVTGSRIRRSEFTANSPVQIITAEAAELEGLVDTAAVLQSASVASGSFQTNNQLTGFVTTGGPGVSTISLRGLGAQRTLVLLNGRRAGPAGTRGQVGAFDLNVIPQSLISRAEILKDGASSVYGSDAIAGVINLITRTNLDRIELNGYISQPLDDGGEVYRGSASWGKTFSKGYLNAAVDYFEQKPLIRSQRDDTSCAADFLFDPNTGQRVDFTDPRTGSTQCYGLFANVLRTEFGDLIYPKAGVTYPGPALGNNSPVAGLFRQARAGFPETFKVANLDEGNFRRGTILSPVKRFTFFASGGYDITDNLELFGEVLVNRRESEQLGSRQFFPSVSAANPNNRRPDTGAPFASILPIIPLNSDGDQSVDYYRVLGGLKGNFGSFIDGWTWELYGQYSKSEGEYNNDIIYNDRVLAVTGASACNQAAITLSGNLPGGQCSTIPGGIPWTSARVLAGQFTDAEKAFFFTKEQGNTTYTHQYIEGTASGDLFTLPAGAVGAAIGFQVRKEEIDDVPGFNARNNNLWGSTAAGRTAGSDTIKEVFGEFEVPLIKGVPFIEDLTLSLSGRYSDYDSYGESTTYKVGLNWQTTDWLRFRATRGTSFRAPALYELYLANQTSFLGQTAVDPCVNYQDSANPIIRQNCAAAGVPTGYTAAGSSSALIITGGGLGVLEPETSEASTLGFVLTPSSIGLSVALDYFEIDVQDEVRTFGAGNIASQCYNSRTFPNDPFCTLLTRAPNNDPLRPNQILTINNSYVNVASQVNRGIDLTTRFTHEFSFGNLTIDSQITWQLEDKVNLLGGLVNDYLGTTFNYRGPDVTGSLSARFDRDDWTYFWGVDFIGKGSDTEVFGGDVFNSTRYATQCRLTNGTTGACTSFLNAAGNLPAGATVIGVPVYYKQFTEFTAYHSLSVRKRLDTWTLQAGVTNVFDERPPAQSAGQFRVGTAALNAYDVIGRRVFVNITKRF